MIVTRKVGWSGALCVAALGAAVLCAPRVARAEGPATPTGKGIAGGIMLGAEVVMIPIAIGGVQDAWPYPVFGLVGAAGGGIGGYFVEQTGSAEGSVYMLAGGMALVIPTVVAVLNVTMYGNDAEDDLEDDEAEVPAAEDESSAGLVSVGERGVRPGMSTVEFYPLYTDAEVARFGVAQGTEVRFPVVSGVF